MSEAPIPTETPKVKKSPLKKRHEAIKYFFGQPLESFENLLNIQPSTSTNQSKIKPTDLDIIRHWMYLEDRKTTSNSTSNSVNVVAKDLVEFYMKYHSSVELSSKRTIESMVSRLVNRTDKIHQYSSLKYAQDQNWIQKNLKELVV